MDLSNVVHIGTRADALKTAYENPNVMSVWVSAEDPEFEDEAQEATIEEMGLTDDDYFSQLDVHNSSLATLSLEPGYSAEDLVDNLSVFMGMVVLTNVRIFVSTQADVDTIQKHFC